MHDTKEHELVLDVSLDDPTREKDVIKEVVRVQFAPMIRSLFTQFTADLMSESKRNLTCHNCKTSKTCLWRKSMDKQFHLCNPCSLYERQHKKPRPVDYKNKPVRQNTKKMDGYVTLHWSQLQMLLDMASKHT